MKRFVFLFVAVWLLVTAGSAQAVWFEVIAPAPAPVELQVERADRDGVDLHLTLPGFEITEAQAGYVQLEIPREGRHGEIGEPAVPLVTRLLRVPLGATVEVRVEAAYRTLPVAGFTGAPRLLPVQPSLPKVPGAAARAVFTVDERAYRRIAPVFAAPAAATDAGLLRGYRLAAVDLHPLNYLPALGLVQIAAEMRVHVRFLNADWAATEALERRYAEPRTYAVARDLTLNFDAVAQPLGEPHFAPSSYVVIGPADALNAPQTQAFIEWKSQRGYYVVAVSLAEAGGFDALAVRSYLLDAYANWEHPPAYVLLLGDSAITPFFTGRTSPNPATDLYFAAMTDQSYLPAFGVGRLPYSKPAELANMLTKILNYEQNLWTGGDAWTKHATFMASDDNHTVSEGTHNWVCSDVLTPDGFTCTKLYAHEGATPAQALAALDAGPTIHAYSGHGSEISWADGPELDESDIETLTNITTPLVLSHACLTGSYDDYPCFGDTWMRIPHGALAFWGASQETFWDEDDILERGEFTGWIQGDGALSSLPWTKSLLDFGLMSVYQHYSGGGNTWLYFEMYNLFGDPETLLYSAPPATIAPAYAAEIPPTATTLDVSVPGHPYAMAGVSIDGHLLGVGYAGVNGVAQVAFNRPLSDLATLTLTVTGENLAPYVGVIRVTSAADDDAADDDDDNRPASGGSSQGGGCGGW
jgi:hypothetical protein